MQQNIVLCYSNPMKDIFTSKLIKWHELTNKRTMPWKGEKEPYKIWLSEIILQQTRVEQGLSYYNKFITCFPTIQHLADARDEEVFKLWEGLGYYSRCKNLLFTARYIVNSPSKKFPETYNEILKLKGVGPYTAAAIASFAYSLPHAVVDGNVYRVLARYFGESLPIDSTGGKKIFGELAEKVLFKEDPAQYNQAIMDFGATVCKPQIPCCRDCVLRSGCVAYKNGLVNVLPVKEKQLLKRERWLYYFIFSCNEEVLVNRREGKGIWENLYEFYLLEAPKALKWTKNMIGTWLTEQLAIEQYELEDISAVYKQLLTHQKLQGQFISIRLITIPKSLEHLQTIKKTGLDKLAFPKFINQHLEQLTSPRQLLLELADI